MGFIYSFATAGGREQCYCSRDLHRLTEYWARTNEAAESSWISHLTTVDNIVDGVWIVRPSPHNSLIAKLGIAAQRVVVSSHWSRIWPQRETSCSFSKDTTLTEMSVVSVGLSRPLSLSILRFSCLSWSVLSSVVSFDRFLQFSSILWLVLFFFFFFAVNCPRWHVCDEMDFAFGGNCCWPVTGGGPLGASAVFQWQGESDAVVLAYNVAISNPPRSSQTADERSSKRCWNCYRRLVVVMVVSLFLLLLHFIIIIIVFLFCFFYCEKFGREIKTHEITRPMWMR